MNGGALRAAGFGALHGFTTRAGGVSEGAFAGMNLGLSSGDTPAKVERNRDLLLGGLGFTREAVVAFHQVHGDRVLGGDPGWFEEEADAAVTNRNDVLLVVSTADCVPLLFHDPVKGVVGAAHCGWKGTAALLAAKVVAAMVTRHGSRPGDVKVALGPCMRGSCYQVGSEVIERFVAAGIPSACWRADPSEADRYLLDLPAANTHALAAAGVPAENVSDLDLCTHCRPELFYSHRRDRGVTGRHWAYVSLREPGGSMARMTRGAGETR
ncbi:MAG TPA: peptidoglycan editing factor PgeF [Trueperaceae bacterium]|nr:peptidoglycan editing factor PgeF [Trueperaceae bacterium]